MWRDMNSGEVVTLEQIANEFKRMKKEVPEDFEGMTLDEYISNCMWYNNGQLENI